MTSPQSEGGIMPKHTCNTCGQEFHGWSIKAGEKVVCPYCGCINQVEEVA